MFPPRHPLTRLTRRIGYIGYRNSLIYVVNSFSADKTPCYDIRRAYGVMVHLGVPHSTHVMTNYSKSTRDLSTRSSKQKKYSPYDILGVSKGATPKEIKLAYFREAKKHHPDVNPNDDEAAARFRRCATSYELLKNGQISNSYVNEDGTTANVASNWDSEGKGSKWYDNFHQGYNNYDNNYRQYDDKWAEQVFKETMEDTEILRETVSLFVQDLQEQLNEAQMAYKSNDYKTMERIARDNIGLIVGVVVPGVLLLRFPAAVVAGMRVAWSASIALGVAAIRMGWGPIVIPLLWKEVVNLMDRKRKRLWLKKKEREKKNSSSGSSSSNNNSSNSSNETHSQQQRQRMKRARKRR
jgi:curved DNA-binding protein CbpA